MTDVHEHHDGPLIAEGESRRVVLFKWLFAPLRFAYKLYFGLVFFLSLTLLYLPFRWLLRRPAGYPRAFRLMKAWGRFLNVALLVPCSVRREAPFPRPPYIICMNHGSYLDIIHTFNVVPDYFLLMGKYELLRWPMFNIFFKGMHIAVNRGSRTEAAKALLRAAREIDEGACVGIFPEGTIPHTAPRMKTFKDGAFKLAIEKQVPIVPITYLDHWKLFGDPEDLLSRGRPGIARAIVHPPVETKGLAEADLDNLRHRVFDTIRAPLIHEDRRRHAGPHR